MSQNVKITSSDGSSIDVLPIAPDFTTLLADGLNFANVKVTLIYLNKRNIDITGILNFQGSNHQLIGQSIEFPYTGGNSQTMTKDFKFVSYFSGQVTYTLTLNTSIGNATSNSIVINYLDVTPQNTKLIVESGAIANNMATPSQTSATLISIERPITPSQTSSNSISVEPPAVTPVKIGNPTSSNLIRVEPPWATPVLESPRTCPEPCPKPSCPACPACPSSNIPLNTKSSLSGSTESQKCEIDYTPIIIIGVLIIILLLILLYLQITNNK
jgi:hypothetical protein